jgi:Phage Tail Collar Domain
MSNLILPRRGFLVGLASLLAAPAVVRAEALIPIKVWRPLVRWRDGYIVLNGAEHKISEFPDLFDAFGHHFGGQGTTFRLPTSGGCRCGMARLLLSGGSRHLHPPGHSEDIRRRLAMGGLFSRPRLHRLAQGYTDVRTAAQTCLQRRRDIR